MDLVTVGKKDTSSGLRKLVGTWSSIQMISSMYGRKVGTYLLLLRQTCLGQQPYRSSSVPPWQSLVGLTSLWPESCLGWPQYPFGIPWTLRIFLLLPQMHIFLGSISCYKIRGCQRSLKGHSGGRPPICFLPTCHPRRPPHSSQSGVRTFCSSAFDM